MEISAVQDITDAFSSTTTTTKYLDEKSKEVSKESKPKDSQVPSSGDTLFGKVDPERIQNYFSSNYLMKQKITDVIESNKSLLIYESQSDPYVVFLKLTGSNDFKIEDIIILIAMVTVFGRSLKSLNKHKNSDSGRKFIEICTKYKIRPSYERGLEGEKGTWTTKVEHCFAAYPLITRIVMEYLHDEGYLNISTSFTSIGKDFQSSTSLTYWKTIDEAHMMAFFHEIKSQAYIKARTFGQDPSTLYKETKYRGRRMTNEEARRLNIIDSRQFVVLGMFSTDILVKILWIMSINCPPFKANPQPYQFSERILSAMNKIQPVPCECDPSWNISQVIKYATEIASRMPMKSQWHSDVNGSIEDEYYHSCGLNYDVIREKLDIAIFVSIACSCRDRLDGAIAKFGLDLNMASEELPYKEAMTVENAFSLLRKHFTTL